MNNLHILLYVLVIYSHGMYIDHNLKTQVYSHTSWQNANFENPPYIPVSKLAYLFHSCQNIICLSRMQLYIFLIFLSNYVKLSRCSCYHGFLNSNWSGCKTSKASQFTNRSDTRYCTFTTMSSISGSPKNQQQRPQNTCNIDA